MYGFYLIAVLAVIGGMIAYIGDRIGMRIGRQRLTLFGLRPKHTSIVITIATGVMIAAASLIVLSIASNDVRTALFRMRQIQQTLATTQSQLAGMESVLAGHKAELEQMIAQRDEAKEELDRARSQLDEVQGQLRAAQEAEEYARARVEDFREIGAKLETRIEELRAEQQSLEEAISRLMLEMQSMRVGELAFQAQEIVLAAVIEAGRPREYIEFDLQTFLERADQIAVQRGALIPGRPRATAIALVDQRVYDDAVSQLVRSRGRFVLRAVSMVNTVRDEPVVVDLQLVEERTIYRRGQVIAERIIDVDGVAVNNEIIALLAEVRERAIRDGMITNEEGNVGEVSGDAFIESIRRVRELGGRVRVQAVAGRDTLNTQGPLQVVLRETRIDR